MVYKVFEGVRILPPTTRKLRAKGPSENDLKTTWNSKVALRRLLSLGKDYIESYERGCLRGVPCYLWAMGNFGGA